MIVIDKTAEQRPRVGVRVMRDYEMERLDDGRWIARCPDLAIAAIDRDIGYATVALSRLIEARAGN